MKEQPTKFSLRSILIVFCASILILVLMSVVPLGLFRHEIITTAIICSTCICGISIICSLIYAINANKKDDIEKKPTPEETELLKEIKAAFSKEPKRICCRCNKISNSIVNVKVQKK